MSSPFPTTLIEWSDRAAIMGHSIQSSQASTFSCYSSTSTVEGPDCPLSTCAIPTCEVSATVVTTLPCLAKQCSTTPTVTTTRPCTPCYTGCYTTTTRITTTESCPRCYTATVGPQPPPECPPYGCVPPKFTCTRTFTAPCADPDCPQTPTVYATPSCNPICRRGCATSVTTTTKTKCPPTHVPKGPKAY